MRNRTFYRHCHLQYVNEFEEKVEAAVQRRFHNSYFISKSPKFRFVLQEKVAIEDIFVQFSRRIRFPSIDFLRLDFVHNLRIVEILRLKWL